MLGIVSKRELHGGTAAFPLACVAIVASGVLPLLWFKTPWLVRLVVDHAPSAMSYAPYLNQADKRTALAFFRYPDTVELQPATRHAFAYAYCYLSRPSRPATPVNFRRAFPKPEATQKGIGVLSDTRLLWQGLKLVDIAAPDDQVVGFERSD